MSDTLGEQEERLYERISRIIESARQFSSRSVNVAMVHAYWLIGQQIVEVEQAGSERADYGDRLMESLSTRLHKRFGRGFSVPTLRRIRQFYLTYPQGSDISEELKESWKRSAVLSEFEIPEKQSALLIESEPGSRWLFPPFLGWSHYLILMRVSDPQARSFYEIEAARESWSTRELERQIASLLFERLSRSRDKLKVIELARRGQLVTQPVDVLKDPVVLEFLDLEERSHWHESDLEQAIIDRLEAFLLELGKGFCFVARQRRLTIDGDLFYVDMVFYNRLLRCFVLIDLKLGKLDHGDLGQMQMYVNYYDRHQLEDWESPTIGIILCSQKNDAMVRITLPEDNRQIHAASYQLYLPSEEQLRRQVVEERKRLEDAQCLSESSDVFDEDQRDVT